MSSPAAGAQGVNVKVSHFGTTRRFKLNLRDININTFEDKVGAVYDLDAPNSMPSSVNAILPTAY